MKNRSEMLQIQQLFDVLLPLSDAGRKDYLSLPPELPSAVVEQTLLLLQTDDGNSPLPLLNELLRIPHEQTMNTMLPADQHLG